MKSIKNHQDYMMQNAQIDIQQVDRMQPGFVFNAYTKNFKVKSNFNNNALNTQETLEENLTDEGSNNQLNLINQSEIGDDNKLLKTQDKLINHMVNSQQNQINPIIRHQRSSSGLNLLNVRKGSNNFIPPPRNNQNTRGQNIPISRDKSGDLSHFASQKDLKYEYNSLQNTPHQKSQQAIDNCGAAGQLNSYRFSSVTRKMQQNPNIDERTVTFAYQSSPLNNEKLYQNFEESIAQDDIIQKKGSDESKYFSGSQSNQRLHQITPNKQTEAVNYALIRPFQDSNGDQILNHNIKYSSNYQNYFDNHIGGHSSQKTTPDKISQTVSREKASNLDSGEKQYFSENRSKTNAIKGYTGDASDYQNEHDFYSIKSGNNDTKQELQQIKKQSLQLDSNQYNSLYGTKQEQQKLDKTTKTANYSSTQNGYNQTQEQFKNKLKNLKDCQHNLEQQVSKLKGGREEDTEKKNMLNLELNIIKKEIIQFEAKMNMM